MQAQNLRPPILCFSGLDPSGGAGLQADIEAISSCGGHTLPIASCLTVQNSVQAFSVSAIDSSIIQQQASVLLDDLQVASCKIGVVPNEAVAFTIANILAQLPEVPVVFDPVFSASHGTDFSNMDTINAIRESLFPLTTVITPNFKELNTITDDSCGVTTQARSLCELGPKYVLVTGADNDTEQVQNRLFSQEGMQAQYDWPRLPHMYHGSGCTLSSSIACYLGLGLDMHTAVEKAQHFTWQSLKDAQAIGSGQWIPKRIR
ncbi:MAG: hydroxymethylpyrimidine/phosphomethylpyrimidine kinase [Gammaproteobacteria bacterium]|nr:hydroxymethylpyrimidine/phosphomethylpyrimidine kinase [Gammaproteobacteria bacterium]